MGGGVKKLERCKRQGAKEEAEKEMQRLGESGVCLDLSQQR